ncbi:E3 ubiquitin-protein ligase MYCBP2 [Hondaea fermentalgiana]|uniref:E3 ubiquitin-protein ligase MYCBP2 n=1 Tax=Hondaea fermentalgiana TaxID=2315210 RepID=A0A2R5GII7_9STRA|nr:E3 ubiquitin-protein ligase MYCBP2 [Hondaea fermentalgiana]|eukprot:GBG30129.1 E3 ubiquitin-protein ligase MYCBP2 [Hondaea fermentalgiana]
MGAEASRSAALAAQAAVQAVQAAAGLGAIVALRPATEGLIVREAAGSENWVLVARGGVGSVPGAAARERQADAQNVNCCKCDVIVEDVYADLVELSNCGHFMCTDCFREHVLATAPRPCCTFPFCECAIAEQDVRATLRPEELEAYTSAGVRNIADQFFQCPKCQRVFALDRDEHDARNAGRVRCVCQETFCADCRASPFHEGMTCEEMRSTHPCRFCKTRVICVSAVSPGNIVVCASQACQQEFRAICGKVRQDCGHPCGGLAEESSCPAECFACLGSEGKCGMCLFPLEESASVVLSCGHAMHVNCVRRRFEAEKSAERASLTFSRCPVCKTDMAHPEALESEFLAINELRSSIQGVLDEARGRASPEEALLEDDAYTLFYCERCRRPYYGGMRQCEESGGAAHHDAENHQHHYCASCTCTLQQVPVCPEHGPGSMQFKCSFCCTPASFFCWGTTHFCIDCHARQMAGERLNRLPLSGLPQCGGAQVCPLGLNHPPNGTPPSQSAPIVLGCSMCQARRAFM